MKKIASEFGTIESLILIQNDIKGDISCFVVYFETGIADYLIYQVQQYDIGYENPIFFDEPLTPKELKLRESINRPTHLGADSYIICNVDNFLVRINPIECLNKPSPLLVVVDNSIQLYRSYKKKYVKNIPAGRERWGLHPHQSYPARIENYIL